LETVDLIPVADRLVRNYSSGMKQRLGIAQALLGNPDLLLLDEPTNGLDPAGIQQVRTLVRDLPKRCGVTVFLSSHLLAEVEQVATHLAIKMSLDPAIAEAVREALEAFDRIVQTLVTALNGLHRGISRRCFFVDNQVFHRFNLACSPAPPGNRRPEPGCVLCASLSVSASLR